VAEVLDGAVGPVVHNPTRGNFVTPNVKRFGSFLEEWSRIYERFGVPAELGLAQAVVESGLSGTVKSEARAVGFCQWLPRNWDRLQGLTANVIEVQNQTTQAAFCAAYLSVLATKYGSFIPALSEHHAGAANVGRAVINGHRLGAEDMRQRYFMGSQFALDLRELSPRTFRDLLGTYGPRSYRYAEMVFGNMSTVASLRASNQQQGIYAIRVTRDVPLTEIAQKSGLSQNEVKRFNPALIRRVPKGATLYLPTMIEEFGEDVSYWHRPAPDAYTAVMSDFLRLTFSREQWEASNFEPVLSEYHRRFTATDCEEGRIMAAAISYALQEVPGTRRVLDEFRTSPKIDRLFEEGVELWTSDPATPR
jgi:hypothetical protein